MEWLAKALEIGGKELKLQALDDEELAAVWCAILLAGESCRFRLPP